MSNIKHTPGPWQAKKNGDINAVGVGKVCRVGRDWDIGDPCIEWTSPADATLCAAAPDLLAACEAYTANPNRCDRFHCGDAREADCPCGVDDHMRAMRAAIAKAKGGE